MGAARTIERNAAKLAYKKFCKTWNAEKALQAKHLAEGKTLKKGEQKLGKKPPFSYWLSMSKKMFADRQKEIRQEQGRIDNLQFEGDVGLDWEDEQELATGQGDTPSDEDAPSEVEHHEQEDQVQS